VVRGELKGGEDHILNVDSGACVVLSCVDGHVVPFVEKDEVLRVYITLLSFVLFFHSLVQLRLEVCPGIERCVVGGVRLVTKAAG